jgi:ABC-2 type transport system permease protein
MRRHDRVLPGRARTGLPRRAEPVLLETRQHLGRAMSGELAPRLNVPPDGPPRPLAGAACVDRLPAPDAEARLFWQLQLKLGGNRIKQVLRESRLRMFLVLLLSGALWIALFGLFAEGFQFLRTVLPDPTSYADTTRAVFNLFYASITVMLLLSAGIMLYASLFRGADTAWLLTLPARAERVFLYKFQQTVVLGSWGFLLLGSPMLVAYGVAASASPWYFAALLPYMAAFVYIPCCLAGVMCLLLVYRLARWRRVLLWGGGAVLAVAAAWAFWKLMWRLEPSALTPDWFQEVLARLRYTESRFFPGWWLSSGLMEAAEAGLETPGERHALTESAMFLALLASHAMLLHQMAVGAAARWYRAAYDALHSERPRPRRARRGWIDGIVMALGWWLPQRTRLLLVKDLRLFRRDPVQWQQFLIFFGLLALYLTNVRRLSHDASHAAWINMVSFLNLAVVGLILSTFTTRFVFPMVSLEGRRFWLLGLLPVSRSAILWSKFLFAAVGSWLPSAALVLISDLLLGITAVVLVLHQVICLLLCGGLAGIAVGLGARLPSLNEESPARIAAAFGGTLNLVLSTAYILSVILLTAVPCHFYLAAQQLGAAAMVADVERLWFWFVAGTAASGVLGVVTTWLPMRMGLHAFNRQEF